MQFRAQLSDVGRLTDDDGGGEDPAAGNRKQQRFDPPNAIADLALEIIDLVGQLASRASTPPAPLDSRLVEEIVHGEDIRRPLGLARSYPAEAVDRSLRLQTRTPASFGGAKQLVARVRLTAADADVSLGEGPEVSGAALSLLLAVSGRRVALDDLDGPGVEVLAAAI